jgi:DNA-nicking Smr family endonuclease
LNKKLSDKDKKDWENFLSNKEKIIDKELNIKNKLRKNLTKTIDLHGFSLEEANIEIEKFINNSFKKNINKIIVITGKGLRSKNIKNPYISKDLGILKNSVPEFIKLNKNLMKIIIEIKEASLEDGGSGAFYIYLKNKEKHK